MHTVLDILQGCGVAAACGLRPFLAVLVVGALASGNVGVDYDHTSFSFLESPWFLLAAVLGLGVSILFRARLPEGPSTAALQGIAIGLGALEFAGTLDDRHSTWWPGLIGGVLCAALASAAAADLFGRVRARLDAEAAGALPLYAEGAGLVLAAASVLAPPVALVGLGFCVWLLLGSRRRGQKTYAGLRILR